MRRNSSKKHHYLPRYYLNGFTNSKGTFFVYDKEKDNIFLTNPSGAFFENNLNTVTFPNGDSYDFLEDRYAEIENQSWGSLNVIRQSTKDIPINPLDAMHLFIFLSFLYWRLPSNTEFVEKLSEKAYPDNNEFDYFNFSGGKFPKEVTEIIKQSQAFKKLFKLIVPLFPFYKDKDWPAKLENWRFLYMGDGKSGNSGNIVGDNPIIVKGDSSNGLVNCLKELVFPVSGKILLISINKPLNKVPPPEFVLLYNTAIIERSQRFVACQNKDFLGLLIKRYKIYVQFGRTDTIMTDMFNMLEQ